MAEQNTTTKPGTTDSVAQSLAAMLPYIGEVVGTSVRDALVAHDAEKESDARFIAQHERNIAIAREENKPKSSDYSGYTERAMSMFIELLTSPLIHKQFDDGFNAGVRSRQEGNQSEPRDNDQRTRQDGQSASQSLAAVGQLNSIAAVQTPLADVRQPRLQISRLSTDNGGANTMDPRDVDETNSGATRRTGLSKMRESDALGDVLNRIDSIETRIANANGKDDSTDQNVKRALHNEQINNLDFETNVRKPKDRLALKFFEEWDNGNVKFAGTADNDASNAPALPALPKSAVLGWLASLGIGAALHYKFGRWGDAMTNVIGRGGKAVGAGLATLAPKISSAGTKIAANIEKSGTKIAAKLGNVESKFTKLGSGVEKAGTKIAAKLGNVESKFTKLGSGVEKAGKRAAKFGSKLSIAGAAVGAVTTGFDAYKKWQSGDKFGAVSRGVGGAADVALNLTGVGALGNLAIGGGSKLLKHFGVIDESAPETIGETVTSIIDNGSKAYTGLKGHFQDMETQKANLNQLKDNETTRLLQSRARSAVKQKPELGDANMVVDKFLGTDQANSAIAGLKEANEHYVSVNGVGGQIRSLFGGDTAEDAQAKIDAAQKTIFDMFDEYVSTYDPNKMHDWNFATQVRIAAEAEAAEAEAAKEGGNGGNVEGATSKMEEGHDYNAAFNPDEFRKSVSEGTMASVLNPQFHEILRQDMSVIGQQLNTQLTG